MRSGLGFVVKMEEEPHPSPEVEPVSLARQNRRSNSPVVAGRQIRETEEVASHRLRLPPMTSTSPVAAGRPVASFVGGGHQYTI